MVGRTVASAPAPELASLRPYQVEAGRAIARSALNGEGLTITVVMARQAGKNELSAAIELFLLQEKVREAVDGIKCAPTLEPQARISMARLWDRIRRGTLIEIAAREART
jgi:hypothetical protein